MRIPLLRPTLLAQPTVSADRNRAVSHAARQVVEGLESRILFHFFVANPVARLPISILRLFEDVRVLGDRYQSPPEAGEVGLGKPGLCQTGQSPKNTTRDRNILRSVVGATFEGAILPVTRCA